ncbi:hypothetical protein LOZ61_003174 [Ophidiomyces ophidiicola]|nr:hypothetical protein LOZ61_003174 [Ophidiomyces ophidiicola]KAI1928229.1 hypothetical protein LOZ60_002543 [Ophidiomyces ophidiicola]KAI1973152.1 hypothetical protein LOZ56_001981 [Ophidiomyces ophidiicola]KAI2027325.1 hypothetical protein LOZ45_002687 [Ophidiomyces ophidiicola]KAI2031646.1 hypothetical protein LOZ48_002678 [Ophidiomyces ophidiicola]
MKSLLAVSAFVASALAAAVPASPATRVIRVPTNPNNHAKIVQTIKDLDLECWKFPDKAGLNADVIVSPEQASAFQAATKDMEVQVMHEDMDASIKAEAAGMTDHFPNKDLSSTGPWYKSYHTYHDHEKYLHNLQKKYPKNSAIVVAGKSYEGRDVRALHLWGKQKGKPAVVFHGTIHAREWITTMVVEYTMVKLLEETTEVKGTATLDNFDFFIFPVTNPDGFVFTQKSLAREHRNWRKNRQPTPDPKCIGTDPNRNYPAYWNGTHSSTDPCSDSYRGPSAGSATEVKIQTEFMLDLAKKPAGLISYIDWHSYGQLFMTPYAYSCDKVPANSKKQLELAQVFADAFAAPFNTTLRVGTTCKTIYPISGDSADWANDVANITYPFAPELRDRGRYGFFLPPDQILDSGKEAWDGVKALFAAMAKEMPARG